MQVKIHAYFPFSPENPEEPVQMPSFKKHTVKITGKQQTARPPRVVLQQADFQLQNLSERKKCSDS